MLLEIKIGEKSAPKARGSRPKICVLKCDVCGNVYERNITYRKLTFHRCSKKCVYGFRKSDGLGGHGADVINLSCVTCDKKSKGRRIGHERKWGWFCSKKCYGQFRSEHPELYVENTTKMHTLESAKKISDSAQMRMSQPDYVHPRLGTHHSEETKQFISKHHKETGCLNGEKNGMFGQSHSSSARSKMSNAVTQRILDGHFKPYGTRNLKGHYTSTKMNVERFYRSSWELAFMKWLDAQEDVVSWEYESVRISYFYAEHKRWYVPDFIVSYVDGKCVMYEIKPKEFITTEKNILKEEAATRWCLENGLSDYQVLTGDDLRRLGILK